MSTISFSGLASGLDTESIISSLMEIEQEPITRLENDQTYLESRLTAYTSFSSYLEALQIAVEGLDSESELVSYAANLSGDDIAATASSTAEAGTYNIEVISLACQQKDVTAEGFADTSTADLSGAITIDGCSLEYEDLSLEELVETVNEGNYGVTASLLNDGTENGYRMVLTADQSGTEIDIVATGSISLDTASDGHTREGSQAHIVVDNIDIYSNQNVIDSAIKGVTLDLFDVTETDESIKLDVSLDTDSISQQVDSFVSAFNNIISFISDQAESDWGNEAEFRSVKRNLQNFLTSSLDVGGNFSSLTSLGIQTDFETGQISIDSTVLSSALESDFESIQKLFLGNGTTDGIAVQLQSYLESMTGSETGMLATKEDSTETRIEWIDEQIERLEMRLEKRQETLEAQFTALETLLSSFNTQSDYLTDWINSLEND